MAVTKARVRELALALDGAYEVTHVDRPAFRTKRKIFATLTPNVAEVNLMFDRATQEFFCEQAPHALAPHPSGWGRMGVTVCDLGAADAALAHSALKAAHALALPKAKAARKTNKP
ncbi:MAG: MmcQ/YjbR family DNA-binding protein [Terricaulis sp.]|nr:MmcQ/YjbR family DNA-binding protein [Terricaulis sp.]